MVDFVRVLAGASGPVVIRAVGYDFNTTPSAFAIDSGFFLKDYYKGKDLYLDHVQLSYSILVHREGQQYPVLFDQHSRRDLRIIDSSDRDDKNNNSGIWS